MENIKSTFQKFFNYFGFKIVKKIEKPFRDFDKIFKFIFDKKKITIFDVGANTGQSINRFLLLFKFCKIFSFEPSSSAFKKLKKNYGKHKDVELNNYALGEKVSKKNFYDYKQNELSGFLKLKKKYDLKKKISLAKIITLDYFVLKKKIKKINILKIDTQGYETFILRGAKNSIKKNIIDIIEIELILGEYYDQSYSFKDIEDFLIPWGYKLIALDRRINIFENKHLYFNALYVSEKIFKKIN